MAMISGKHFFDALSAALGDWYIAREPEQGFTNVQVDGFVNCDEIATLLNRQVEMKGAE